MTTPGYLYGTDGWTKFSGTWTYIKTPKPADKEGGIWVEQVLKACGHNQFTGYHYEWNICSKPIQKQEWLFVKSGDRVSSLNF